MPFLAAGFLLAVFVANVAIGATYQTTTIGNVGEMLILLGMSVLFVVGILQRERAALKPEMPTPARTNQAHAPIRKDS